MNLAAAYRSHPKHAPGRARTSMVHADPARVQTDPDADPLKIRLRDAWNGWSNATNGSRDEFATALGVTVSEIKRGLAPSDKRPVRLQLILAAEALAAQQRSPISDAELGAAVRRVFTLIAAIQESAA